MEKKLISVASMFASTR